MNYNEKQIQIIEIAEQLFADKGFDGSSIREIADIANINVAMISYYFGNKEKLLEAIFLYRSLDSAQKLETVVLNKSLKPLEKIAVLIELYIDKFLSHPAFFKVMMAEQVNNKRSVTHDLIFQFKMRNQLLIKQLIQEGQKTGVFKKTIDIPMMMNILIGTIIHMVATQHFYKEINHLQDLTEMQFQKHIKKKLGSQLKYIFKTIITNEG